MPAFEQSHKNAAWSLVQICDLGIRANIKRGSHGSAKGQTQSISVSTHCICTGSLWCEGACMMLVWGLSVFAAFLAGMALCSSRGRSLLGRFAPEKPQHFVSVSRTQRRSVDGKRAYFADLRFVCDAEQVNFTVEVFQTGKPGSRNQDSTRRWSFDSPLQRDFCPAGSRESIALVEFWSRHSDTPERRQTLLNGREALPRGRGDEQFCEAWFTVRLKITALREEPFMLELLFHLTEDDLSLIPPEAAPNAKRDPEAVTAHA
jgi:hypothetical protein